MRLRRLFQISCKFAPGDGLRNALQRLRVGTAMTRDGREYEKQGHSCDSIVRDAEKELDDDNYLLFLMYKACRDHYCVRHVSLLSFVHFEEYELAEYSACKTVEYLRTYQPDQVRDLVNDVSLVTNLRNSLSLKRRSSSERDPRMRRFAVCKRRLNCTKWGM